MKTKLYRKTTTISDAIARLEEMPKADFYNPNDLPNPPLKFIVENPRYDNYDARMVTTTIKEITTKSDDFSWKRIICWIFGHSRVKDYTRKGLPVYAVDEVRDGDAYDNLPLMGFFPGTGKRSPNEVFKCNRCGKKLYEFYRY